MAIIIGNDGGNTLAGTEGRDLVYGFDPNGPQGTVSAITATRVASGLTSALFVTAPPGDTDHLFVVQQTGTIRVLDVNTGQLSATPVLTIPVDSSGERGLLGLAFDPNYATNGFFYVYHTVAGTPAHNQVDRYHVPPGSTIADPASATPIISLDNLSTASNHNGGWIGFGPDGDLYIAAGENANAPNAQTLSNLLGKVLRIDVHSDAFPGDPSANYAIPADNPFVATAGARGEIYDLGLRNPFRNSFDRGTGDFYIADVGQGAFEEIDRGVAGANYGWPNVEGPQNNGGTLGPGTLTAPIFSYDHSVGQAIIGGYVYRGTAEGLQGQYFYADEVAGKVFTLHFDAGGGVTATERTSQITTSAGAINNPTSFGEDGRGNLYLSDFDGDVFRLTPLVASLDQGDTLSGNGGDDMLFAGSGNDVLDGGPGADALNGGAGIDTATYAASTAGVTVSLATSHGTGGDAQGDILSDIENLIGSALADNLTGDANANTFDGHGGGDTLTGNAGDDLFVYSTGYGATTVMDLVAGAGSVDRVDLRGVATVHTLGDVLSHAAQVGADTVITFAAGDVLTLHNVTATALDAGDFLFSPEPPPPPPPTPTPSAAVQTFARPADFDGDGRDDILFRDGNGGVEVASGGAVASATFAGSAAASWHIEGLDDFNGDGRDDVLWRNDDGNVVTWAMNGAQIQSIVNAGSASASWHIAGTGDLNGDGRDDVVWRNDDGSVTTWLMNGGQVQSIASPGGAAPSWHIQGEGDFNGDGRDDILFRNDDGRVVTWQMNGGQIQSIVDVGSAPQSVHLAGSGDLNGDGRDDILFRGDDGHVVTWLMNNGQVSSIADVGSADASWHIRGAGDVNADGRDDILWQNDDGRAVAWLMNGAQLVATPDLGTAPATWQFGGGHFDLI